MANLAVIPARGNSRRIPHKNIKDFNGKPLLAWTIEAAQESGVFDKIIVSTDDQEIAHLAMVHGVDVPFMRDKSLADEMTPAYKATLDVAQRFPEYDNVCQLMPTSPLRDAKDVFRSHSHFIAQELAWPMISVTDFGWQNPHWAVTSDFYHIHVGKIHERSQDMEKLYCITGAVWWIKSKYLLDWETFYTGSEQPFIMDWIHGIDIDTMQDWMLAERLA